MATPLADLTDGDILALALAIRVGRLSAPYTTAALQRSVPPAHAEAAAAWFQKLAGEGLSATHLAVLLEAAAESRARAGTATEAELVWTGPELPGTVNRDTATVVRELFASAKAHVIIAWYAIHQGRELFKTLAARMDQDPSLRVRMFLEVKRGWQEASPDAVIVLRFADRFRGQEWPGERLPEVYYDPRSLALESDKKSSLHARCVVIDRGTALVTSANFTEAAQMRNIEAGVLLRCKRTASQLAHHFESLAEAGLLVPVPFDYPHRLPPSGDLQG